MRGVLNVSREGASGSTVEPPNNGHSGGKHFVHYSEVVPLSEVLPLSDYQCKPHKL